MSKGKKVTQGLTITREQDASEWFTQIIQKAELIEYSPVSGCYILRPRSFFIWEEIKNFLDKKFKEDGVKNAYFPLFIPESLLQKESSHVEGFAPEVAWVEHGGNTKLKERLAVRPTSETIMYDAYGKWVRSYKDLPIRLNQWCNVVRWEFKHCTPFLRSREFLWQEGHTAFAEQKDAMNETHTILKFYEQTFKELLAIPVLAGRKSEKEKFAGADYTLSLESFFPNGKAIQGCTSHHLGQNFSRKKAFNISFTNNEGKKEHVWQNSWGFSTRTIGVVIMMHSDDKGLVLPPKIAQEQVVIIPILFDKTKTQVMKEVDAIEEKLAKNHRVHVDDRDKYSPGWKFNEWETKGTPLRIEIGPRDLEKGEVVITRRDTNNKKAVKIKDIEVEVAKQLDAMHDNLYKKANKHLKESVVEVTTLAEAKKEINKEKKMVFAPWCALPECEEHFKEETGGAKSLNAPFKQPKMKADQKCFVCKEKAQKYFYLGKSY